MKLEISNVLDKTQLAVSLAKRAGGGRGYVDSGFKGSVSTKGHIFLMDLPLSV